MARRINKPNKFCKLFGVDIDYENNLTDPEVRMYHLYLRIVDWDSKHREVFGLSNISVRDLKKHYLHNWSEGKISETRNSLVEKGWFIRESKTVYGVKNYYIYRLRSVQTAEHCIHHTRQGIPIDERDVHQTERSKEDVFDSIMKEKDEVVRKMSSWRSVN